MLKISPHLVGAELKQKYRIAFITIRYLLCALFVRFLFSPILKKCVRKKKKNTPARRNVQPETTYDGVDDWRAGFLVAKLLTDRQKIKRTSY